MTIIYFAETDTLAVDLRDEPATETDDLTDDVLVDDNAQRQIVGLTIDQASKHVDLGSVQIEGLPRSTCSCALALLCRPERPKAILSRCSNHLTTLTGTWPASTAARSWVTRTRSLHSMSSASEMARTCARCMPAALRTRTNIRSMDAGSTPVTCRSNWDCGWTRQHET